MSGQPALDERIPCPDDMCVGILGADGHCGTCGRQGDPTAAAAARAAAARMGAQDEDLDDEARQDEADEPDGGPDEAAAHPTGSAEPAEAGFDADERVLCPDEMCTGVLGPDGACGTCGRRA